MGRTEEAATAFNKVLTMNAKDTDALTHLADMALKSTSRPWWCWFMIYVYLIFQYLIENDNELGKSYLLRALDVNPNLAEVHYHLGLIYYAYLSFRSAPSTWIEYLWDCGFR